METTAIIRGVHISAQKARLVADMVRGKSVAHALNTLTFTPKKAAGIIKKALESHGFTRQQGSVYFGDVAKVDAVSCVLAVMDLAKNNPWFEPSVKDIRMLRIEENNNLMPAVKKAVSR